MRVLIADDHPLFRAALSQAVLQALPEAAIDEAHDNESLRGRASAEHDIVLLDLLMPGGRSFAPLAWLRSQFPGTAVVIISATENPEVIRQAHAFGAAAYIPKSSPPAELVAAIRTVADCGQWYPAGILGPTRWVPELVAVGRLNKQIAADLGIEETTVKAHVSAALAKLGARNRTQASMVFRELEIQDTDQITLE